MAARLLALAAVAALASPAAACPFCSAQGQTLSGEMVQADFIVLGETKNVKRDPNEFGKGTTELHVQSVVKSHPYVDGKKMLLLPRIVEGSGGENKFLVFCSVYPTTETTTAGAVTSSLALANVSAYQLDPYRGEPVKADSKMPEYMKGAIAVREKGAADKLKFFFDYLDSPDLVIGSDAYMEFGNADYKDVRPVAEKLPADKILGWLTAKDVAMSKLGLYGLLLGHCGGKSHAEAVRAILDDPTKQFSSGLDGLIAGYVLLDPKSGADYLFAMLKDEKKDFAVRYAGLKVLRFFWEYRPDVLGKEKVLDGMKTLVAQSDIADLPIEDLRKWDRHELTDFILEQVKAPAHKEVPIVGRAALRFALTVSAKCKPAAEFVEAERKRDPERVSLVAEMLKDEQTPPPAKK